MYNNNNKLPQVNDITAFFNFNSINTRSNLNPIKVNQLIINFNHFLDGDRDDTKKSQNG